MIARHAEQSFNVFSECGKSIVNAPALSEARLELTDQGMVRYALKRTSKKRAEKSADTMLDAIGLTRPVKIKKHSGRYQCDC